MVQLYTGNGKGKTTAAFGLACRAAGAGLSVAVVQFMKPEPSAEGRLAKKLGLFPVFTYGYRDFLRPTDDIAPHRKYAVMALSKAKELLADSLDVLVLDEIVIANRMGLVSREEIESLFALCPSCEIIITGRDAPEWLIKRADLVTEMKKIKHYFDKGISARIGIEY